MAGRVNTNKPRALDSARFKTIRNCAFKYKMEHPRTTPHVQVHNRTFECLPQAHNDNIYSIILPALSPMRPPTTSPTANQPVTPRYGNDKRFQYGNDKRFMVSRYTICHRTVQPPRTVHNQPPPALHNQPPRAVHSQPPLAVHRASRPPWCTVSRPLRCTASHPSRCTVICPSQHAVSSFSVQHSHLFGAPPIASRSTIAAFSVHSKSPFGVQSSASSVHTQLPLGA